MKNTYWNGRGKYKQTVEALQKMIPYSGTVDESRPMLERLRVAINCYHDLYNNGLCNLATDFENAFGVLPPEEGGGYYQTDRKIERRVESAMDRFICAAASEQGISLDVTARAAGSPG